MAMVKQVRQRWYYVDTAQKGSPKYDYWHIIILIAVNAKHCWAS